MLIVPDKKHYVTKSEKLLKARYELNELALKLVSIIYSNVKRGDELGKDYQIRVQDLANLMGKSYGEIYNELKMATKELLENPVYIENDNHWIMFNWISDAEYKDGVISFTISKRLKPLIIELQDRFLKYKLENILNLRGVYSIRIYEILKDWLELNNRYGNKAEKIVSLAEFREFLEIPLSYKFFDIKRQILNKAKIELEKHTDILFEYEEIKTGRKVTHLKFLIKQNPSKLQSNNSIQDNYFKSRKAFVTLLRKNYSGNGKFFGFKTIDGVSCWLGLDNEGLVYATSGKDIKDFNGVESAEIYEFWLKVAQNSELYKELISEGICLKDLALNNKELWLEFREDLIRLKEEGII
jgi:plasmid replication initiation protein